ncbi:hypothetical protein [Arcobacter sp.]|uniref:hypothetical protein n=1 Tax=Arcobacter sp. TaxID=1872629 RepID=UPI003D114AEF
MIKKSLISLFVFFMTSLNAQIQLDTSIIKNYSIIKEFYIINQKKFMAIRSYEYNSRINFLLIDLDTLKTSVISQNEKKKLKKTTDAVLLKTNYFELREKALDNSEVMANAGINDSINKIGINLTIDMCPSSKKGYEKELFEEYLKFNESNKKVPIAIAITYKWVNEHKKEFLSLIENKNLDITWINHSTNHYYNPFEKLSENFMLNSKTNLEEEVIEVEKMLLLNNQIPSMFFRFPGLISNKKIVNSLVNRFSLLPLGTNNWLAKSKKSITNGDIILIHGNLNEKQGVVKLIQNKKDIKQFDSIYNSLLIH